MFVFFLALSIIGKAKNAVYSRSSACSLDRTDSNSNNKLIQEGFIDLDTFNKLSTTNGHENIKVLEGFLQLSQADEPIGISMTNPDGKIDLTVHEKKQFIEDLLKNLSWCYSLTQGIDITKTTSSESYSLINFHEVGCPQYTDKTSEDYMKKSRCSRCTVRKTLGWENMKYIPIKFYQKTS